MIEHVNNGHFKISIDNDILYLKFKKGAHIDLPVAIRIVTERLIAQRGKAYLIYCDISELHSITLPARNYMSKEGSVLKKALAVLAPTQLSRVLALFYLTISPPKFPVEIFQDEESAIEFLKGINNKNQL